MRPRDLQGTLRPSAGQSAKKQDMYEISSGIQIRKTRRRLHFRSGEAEFEAKTVIAYSDKGFYTTYTFGVESVLAGLRDRITDDDELLTAACMVIDGLLAGLEGGVERP